MKLHVSTILTDMTRMSYYLGTNDLNLFWSSLFYGYIGVVIMLLIDVAGRDKKASYSPEKFDWPYFIMDNGIRFILNILLVFVSIRFFADIFNRPITQYSAVLIGIGSDQLAAVIKKKKNQMFSSLDSVASVQQESVTEVSNTTTVSEKNTLSVVPAEAEQPAASEVHEETEQP